MSNRAVTVSGTSTIVSNEENRASRSSFTPATTKKMGMKIPKPIPSSFSCRPVFATALSRSTRLTMAPAMNAPSTTSRPKRPAKKTSTASRTNAMRTLIWALVRCMRPTAARIAPDVRAPTSTRPSTATSRKNRPSNIAVFSTLAPEEEKNSDSMITVAKSAIDAPAITSCPKAVPV